jgi:hypothetical protein
VPHIAALNVMMNILTLIVLLTYSVIGFSNERAEGLYQELLSICEENPDYYASSVSLYEPDKASDVEIKFQVKAEEFRKVVDMLYLLPRRKAAPTSEVKCIDNIQNTWPG